MIEIPPPGEARVTYNRIIGQVAQWGAGVTRRSMQDAAALALEIESDRPDEARCRELINRLGLKQRYLPWRRTPGTDLRGSLAARWLRQRREAEAVRGS